MASATCLSFVVYPYLTGTRAFAGAPHTVGVAVVLLVVVVAALGGAVYRS